jgi:hypothetical protein
MSPEDMEVAVALGAAVLQVLRAAGLNPPFGMDQGTAEELWGIELFGFSVDEAINAARAFGTSADGEFPTVGELKAVVLQTRRDAAIQRGMANRHPDQTCPFCDDTGFEDGPPIIKQLPQGEVEETSVQPCHVCRPEQLALLRGGHFKREHETRGGCAECRPRK